MAAFRTLLDFLKENDRNEPLAGTPSLITQQLENLSYCVMSTEYSGGGSECVSWPLGVNVVSEVKSMTISER
jgi:hypothetical protein